MKCSSMWGFLIICVSICKRMFRFCDENSFKNISTVKSNKTLYKHNPNCSEEKG